MDEFQHVEGLSALSDALKLLPINIGRNVLRGATGAGAAVVRVATKDKAPYYHGKVSDGHPPTGTLKRSIYQKQIRELSSDEKQVFYVGVRRGKKYRNQGKKGNLSQDAYYWTWVEFGHWFVPKNNLTVTRRNGQVITGHWAEHRAANRKIWVPAHPFLRPAFDAAVDRAQKAIANYMAERIPKEAAKLRRW